MDEPTIPPGFMAVHGNHPEALRDLLTAWMARHPLDPLEDEWVLVQSNGVAQWLRLALARDVADGGLGIAAALRTELPSRFQWLAYRTVLGEGAVPAQSPFDKDLLLWRLLRMLPALLSDPVFTPLARFLADDADLRKRHQLAERLADLFDQYQVYRADWLAGWARGEDTLTTARGALKVLDDSLRWQPQLWRALLADVGPDAGQGSRAAVHQRFMQAVQAWPGGVEDRPAGLPRRLVVFGISSLPQQSLEVLAALSRWTQVLLCVHNPCAHDWSQIVADKDLLRAHHRRQQRRPGRPGQAANGPQAEGELHQNAHPLLAAWGKQGRDFIGLLDLHDAHETYASRFAAMGQRIDLFDPNPRDSLLRQLQDDIRELRPLAETRAQWPAVDAQTDASIRFHATHSPQREVEVLHDELLAAFAADPTLTARDVIVMVPDIAAYAPHIQGVFGLHAPGDARYLPYGVADQGQRHHDPLLGALERLLSLPQSRVAASDMLDWLEVPAVRARFGIDEADLPLLRRWITAANVRWGLHAAHRASLGLPDGQAQNSWDFGLQRMLLGYAVGSGAAWQGVEPQDEIGGLDAVLLGHLVALLATLERHWRVLATPATPAQWGERLRALLADCFRAEEGPAAGRDGLTLMRLEDTLQQWLSACSAAGLQEPLPLSVVREHWLAQLDAGSLQLPFFGGGITFATLMPMRAIPFRFVALLGMNDGDYPRTRVPMDFDLMGQDYRPGDRSRREDDRYLFLEALLSARERLHISWVGRSIHDDTTRPPSVLVAQLRDHLAAGWRLQGVDADVPPPRAGALLLHALTVTHRLQPFHGDYFTDAGDRRLRSYAHEWHAGPVASPSPAVADAAGISGTAGPVNLAGTAPSTRGAAAAGPADTALPPWLPEGPLTLRRMADFVKDPVRAFFQLRMGVHFGGDDPVADDQEPFALDALQNWQLQDRLIQAQKMAVLEGQPHAEALHAELARIAGTGALPAGAFAQLQQQVLAEPMDKLFADYASALAQWPHAVPDRALDHAVPGLDAALHLQDWLGDLRADAQGDLCRMVLDSSSLLRLRRWRRDRILPHWVVHVAAHLREGAALQTRVFSKAGSITLAPLDREAARTQWLLWLQAWQEGLRAPLPMALHSALALLERSDGQEQPSQAALEAARSTYEDHDPAFGTRAECEDNPYLGRAFADFQALWSGGAFAQWSARMLGGLCAATQGKVG
jgi:exodeoxyribonuclease V gamma subunit